MRVTAGIATLALVAGCSSTGDVRSSSPAAPASPTSPSWNYLRSKYDADHDGRIARAEYPRSEESFRHLDADGDGVVSAADFDARWDGVPRVADFEYGVGGPEVGDPAPDFRLRTTSGEEIELAALHAKKPLVLIFGSFT